MIRPAVLAATAALGLSACGPETSTSQGSVPFGPYYIVGIGADAVPTRNATLNLMDGAISGTGPCNSFTAVNSATLPAIQITSFTASRASCEASALEQRYFAALQQATSAEYAGQVLTLKGPTWITFEPGTRAPQ